MNARLWNHRPFKTSETLCGIDDGASMSEERKEHVQRFGGAYGYFLTWQDVSLSPVALVRVC